MGCGESLPPKDWGLNSVQCEPYDIEGMTYYRAILEGLHPTEISDVKLCADRAGDLRYDDLYEYSCWSDLHLGYTGENTVVHCASQISASIEYHTPLELTNRTIYYRVVK